MLEVVTNLFDKFRSKPTFKSDMKKIFDVAKNGTVATKIVYGVGAVLVSAAAVRAVAGTTQTVLELANLKGESRREPEPQEIMIERMDSTPNTLPVNVEEVQEAQTEGLNLETDMITEIKV